MWKICAKYNCFHLLLYDMKMSLDGYWSSLDMVWPTLDKFWSRVTFPLDRFWSRLDTFWTRLEICFHKCYKKCGLTFEYEKKNFTAFLQIIYLNFGANNTYEIQQFFIYPWTRYGPHWTCFGPVVQKKSMWTSIEIALTVWPFGNLSIYPEGWEFALIVQCLPGKYYFSKHIITQFG